MRIIPRAFAVHNDALEADRLLGENKYGDVRLDKDMIGVVEGEGGKLVAITAARPCVLVHEFRVDENESHGLGLRRLIAESLFSFCAGWLVGSGNGPRTLLFIVKKENRAMQKFMEEHGAVIESDGAIYKLEVGRVLEAPNGGKR